MSFEKKVCVLKQTGKGFSADGRDTEGVCYLERWGEELTVNVRCSSLAPLKEGKYLLLVLIGDTFLFSEYRGMVASFSHSPSIAKGLCVAIVHTEPTMPVLFGRCGTSFESVETLISLAEKKIRVPMPLPPYQIPVSPTPNEPLAPTVPLPDSDEGYVDEAIAEYNYFEGQKDETGENENAESVRMEEGEKEKSEDTARQNEDDAYTGTYYKENEERLKKLFSENPVDERLKEVFPRSKWVKVGTALIGIVYKLGRPKYVCVAHEAPMPREMHGVFVPFSPFSKEGMFVEFRSAETGELVGDYQE